MKSVRRCLPAFAWLSMVCAAVLPLTEGVHAREELAGTFSQPESIEARLAAARSELGRLTADADPELRGQLKQLVAMCQYHLGAVKFASDMARERDRAATDARTWNGFPTSPPYSILSIDKIRLSRAANLTAAEATEMQIRLSSRAIEMAQNKLAGHQEAGRRFEETTIDATTPEERLAAERATTREAVASRIMAEEIGRLRSLREAQRAELAAVRAKIELADSQLHASKGKVVFPARMRDTIVERISRERADAVRKLAAAGESKQSMDPLLAWKVEFLDLEEGFWNQRFTSFGTKDPEVRDAALQVLSEYSAHLDTWDLVGTLRAKDATTTGGLEPALLQDARQQVTRLERLVGFAINDLGGGADAPSLPKKLLSVLRSVWDAELYLAEKDAYVDGRKVTTYRAVTPGKLVQLALIFLVGWYLLKYLTRWIRHLILRRGIASEATAALASKWIFGTGLVLLAIYGLNRVHIPFTALAFLGGALAIGVGFGTQTLLKNFISGLILILERPFKLGDLVEVEGITGRITKIGMRASVVQHFDGIDTLIPNSSLLENQVTNWTFSHSRLRNAVTVGVAYGSPTREVAKILLGVAREHGLVLDEPGPEVRLEDFSDSSLLFRLLFWFDADKIQRDPLASDIRFMIDKALAEAGIVIAFPQRDIHLDTSTPLRVEIEPPTT